MANDVLILGGVAFTDFSAPDKMPFGGKQAMAIHKLPGGKRVIDTLGPDDADYSWSGQFYGNDAYSTSLLLDAMRAAGEPVPLTWGGQFWMVLIADFQPRVVRLPVLVEYSITVVVSESPMQGVLGSVFGTIDQLIGADLDAMDALGGLF
jgi:hypothetical protein